MKSLLTFALCLIALCVEGANPTFQSFNGNQFTANATANSVVVKSGAKMTNSAIYGLVGYNAGGIVSVDLSDNDPQGGSFVGNFYGDLSGSSNQPAASMTGTVTNIINSPQGTFTTLTSTTFSAVNYIGLPSAAATNDTSKVASINGVLKALSGGGFSAYSISNSIATATNGQTIVLGGNAYDGGDYPIYFPVGVSVSGLGSEISQIQIYNTSLDATTNGGALALSDNCTVSSLFVNQTNLEQFPIQPIGSQRKNQTTQTLANQSKTSTNVVLRGIKANGAKLQSVVMDATNTMSWKIVDCELSANGTTPLSFGTTPSGAGEASGYSFCTTSNYLEVVNTSLSTTVGTGGSLRAGLYINSPGMVKAALNNVYITRADGTVAAGAIVVAGTNTIVDVSISGSVKWLGVGGESNAYDVLIIGTNNTIFIGTGITNVYNIGISNTIIWRSVPVTGSPFGNLNGLSISNVLSLNTNTLISYGSGSAAANKSWNWNSTLNVYTNSSNARQVTNNSTVNAWEMYSAGTLTEYSGSLFGKWYGLTETPVTVAPQLIEFPNYSIVSRKSFNIFSNSWIFPSTLEVGQNSYVSSNGIPYVIYKDSAGSIYTNRLDGSLLNANANGTAITNIINYVRTVTANNTLIASDSSVYLNNSGASGAVTNTLPAAVAGEWFQATVVTAQNFCFDAAGTDTIRDAASVSAAGGLLFSSTIGNTVRIYCPIAGAWYVDYGVGTWTAQ